MSTSTLLILSVLALAVAIHEFGHLIVAKLFGVGVRRYSIGFGKVLFAKKFGETEYALSVFPLISYCQMVSKNDADAASFPQVKIIENKPLWQKLLVYFAGPAFNAVSAIFFFATSFVLMGTIFRPPVIGGFAENSAAQKTEALNIGDTIKAMSGVPVQGDHAGQEIRVQVKSFDDAINFCRSGVYESIQLEVISSAGTERTVTVTPEQIESQNDYGEKVMISVIGIQSVEAVRLPVPVITAVHLGFTMTVDITGRIFKLFAKMFQGTVPVKKSLAGPVGMVRMGNQSYEQNGFGGLLFYVAFVSVNLAIFNLIPLLVLVDGGQMVILTIEAIIGRPFSLATKNLLAIIGISLFALLLGFGLWNDLEPQILRLLAWLNGFIG